MPTRRKSYAIVTVGADGKLPVPVAQAEDFGIEEGDLAGLRKLTGGKWELTFWRQLHPKGCGPTKTAMVPNHVAIAKKLHDQ